MPRPASPSPDPSPESGGPVRAGPLPLRWVARPLPLSGWHALWVVALAFAWLAATAWVRPLTLPDEGRYVGIALEMLQSGDWGTPTLAGLPFFHKPPLFYWITASALSVFGVNEWAGRLASLLGATAAAGAIFLLARRWASEPTARLVLPVLLTQPLWFMGAQFANMDMLVAGCISCTIALCGHAALQMQNGRPWRNALLAAYVLAALGVLAKGLIGAVIPALVLFVWLAAQRQWRTIVRLLWLPGLAAFVAMAVPWFLQMQRLYPDFMHYFFMEQHFKRFAHSGFNNAEPSWFYPVVLTLLSLPWVAWLAVSVNRSYWQRVRQQPLLLLMWVWLAVVVGFFSMPQSKLLGYVLPAVPPLALLIADAVGHARRRGTFATYLLAAALCLGLVVAVKAYQRPSTRPLAEAFAAGHQAGEPVFFVGAYFYDFGFYARSPAPASVVDSWNDPQRLLRDNWRRELAESAAFAPQSKRLVVDAELLRSLCASRISWVAAPTNAAQDHPFLALSLPVAGTRDASLWRVDSSVPEVSRSLGCRAAS